MKPFILFKALFFGAALLFGSMLTTNGALAETVRFSISYINMAKKAYAVSFNGATQTLSNQSGAVYFNAGFTPGKTNSYSVKVLGRNGSCAFTVYLTNGSAWNSNPAASGFGCSANSGLVGIGRSVGTSLMVY